jgi:hypothetical protein
MQKTIGSFRILDITYHVESVEHSLNIYLI